MCLGMTDFILTEQGGVAHLRLNRPQAANSLPRPFWTEFPAAVRALGHAGTARVLVLSGEGKHFCAGIDVSMLASGGLRPDVSAAAREAFVHDVRGMQDTFSALAESRLPVIAAIHGACIGAGLDMVSACDLRFAAPDAYFRIEEINIGMMADVGSLQRLPRLLPDAVLRQMAFCGMTLTAARAEAVGFVNAVAEDVLAAAMEAASAIAARAPLAVSGSKAALNFAREHTVAESLEQCALLQAAIWHTPDILEAMRARAAREAGAFLGLQKV
jgi:enoyl-CoA hydratase